MRNSPQMRILVTAALVAIVSLSAFIFALATLHGYGRETSRLVEEFDRNAAQEDRARSIRNALQNTESDRARLVEEYVVGADGVVGFIEQIETIGERANVDLSVDTIEVEEEGEPTSAFEPLTMRFRAEGDWRSLYHAFSLIETMPLPLSFLIVRLDTERGGGADWRGTFSISVLKVKE